MMAQVEPHVQRNLVIAASSCVQLAADRADQFRKPPLDRHVDIFVLRSEFEPATVQFRFYRFEPPDDAPSLAGREDSRPLQRLTMRYAALDVLCVQPSIDSHGSGERFDEAVRRFCESPAPRLPVAKSIVLPTSRHQDDAFLRWARIFSRNAFKRIKPSASFWLYTSSSSKVTMSSRYSDRFDLRPAKVQLPLYSFTRAVPVTSCCASSIVFCT